ncbi:hypothetical protein HYW76_02530 [Candidatus Pacearchaeota archaeon]|nr:hypothetical protein [Candidatus Pacearchaeota archaeon]
MKRNTVTNKFMKLSRNNPLIDFCWEKPKKVIEIKNAFKLKRSTLAYYLTYLEDNGMIERKRIQEKETGRPTMITINKEKIEENKDYSGDKFFIDDNTRQVLSAIRDSKKPLTNLEIDKIANTDPDASYYLDKADEYGLIEVKYNLTKKGLAFLNKKRKYIPYEKLYSDDE